MSTLNDYIPFHCASLEAIEREIFNVRKKQIQTLAPLWIKAISLGPGLMKSIGTDANSVCENQISH